MPEPLHRGRRAANLGASLIEVARAHRERPALWCGGETLSYGQLLDRAGPIALALQGSQAVHPGDRVAILSERRACAYVGILAALVAGAAYVPLNPRYPHERNRRILERSGAKVLICSEQQKGRIAEIVTELPDLSLIVLPESRSPVGAIVPQLLAPDLPEVDPDATFPCEEDAGELAYILFTSGSTGVPKGVPISHANVFAYLQGVRSLCDIGSGDRVLQLVDLTFDLSVHDMFLTWLSGACLYSVPENATLLWTRFVEEHEITSWLAVPSTAALVKQSGLLTRASMPSLRYGFFCGEALTGPVAEACAAAAPGAQIINLYGPTEATVAFSAFPYPSGQADPPAVVSLGKPFAGQHMGLFTTDGERTDGSVGEICLSGSQVMSGYWQAPEITGERFFEAEGRRWYRTGDLGHFEPDQGFSYHGRVDRQVKIRGFRVELQEVEVAVRRAAGCDLVAVVPWPLLEDGSAMGCVAFVAPELASEADALAECRGILPDYMVPARIHAIDEIPLNSNGKTDYKQLQAHPALSVERKRARKRA